MNLSHKFQNIVDDFLDDIDNGDAEAIAISHCPACDGTGFTSWQEWHPYGGGAVPETLYEICPCVVEGASVYVLTRMADGLNQYELDQVIASLVKMRNEK